MIETIQWTDAGVVMIDQTRLPREEKYVTCTSYQQVADAIRHMIIRGAPAIGVAAAMGVALGIQQAQSKEEFEQICKPWPRLAPRRSTCSGLSIACAASLRNSKIVRSKKFAPAWWPRRGRFAWKISPSTSASAAMALPWSPTGKPS